MEGAVKGRCCGAAAIIKLGLGSSLGVALGGLAFLAASALPSNAPAAPSPR